MHFIVECTALEGKRNYNLLDRNIEDPTQRLIEVLYKQEDHRGVGWMIRALWLRRKAILACKAKMHKESKARIKKHEGISRSDPGPMRRSQTPIRKKAIRYSTSRG